MYNCQMVDHNILELQSLQMRPDGNDIRYWYYDIKNWKRSITGRIYDVPTQDMEQCEIDWVKKNYIPKVNRSKFTKEYKNFVRLATKENKNE